MSAGIQIPTQLGLSVSAQSASGPTQVSLGSTSRNYVSSFNKSAAKASSLAALSRTLNEQEQLLSKQQDRLTKEEARLGAALGADPGASVDDAKTRAAQDAFLNIRGRLWAEKRAQEILSQEGGGAAGQAEALARGLSKTDLANTPFVDGAVPTLLGAISAARNKDAGEARKAAAEAKDQSALDYTSTMLKEARAAGGDIKKLGDAWTTGVQNLRGLGLNGKQINSYFGTAIESQFALAKTPAEQASILSVLQSPRPNGVPAIVDSIPGGQMILADLQVKAQAFQEHFDQKNAIEDNKLRDQVLTKMTDLKANSNLSWKDLSDPAVIGEVVPEFQGLSDIGQMKLLDTARNEARQEAQYGKVEADRISSEKMTQAMGDFQRGVQVDIDSLGLNPQHYATLKNFIDPQVQRGIMNGANEMLDTDAKASESYKTILAVRGINSSTDAGKQEIKAINRKIYNNFSVLLENDKLTAEFTNVDWNRIDKSSAQYMRYQNLMTQAMETALDVKDLNAATETGKTLLKPQDTAIDWRLIDAKTATTDPKYKASLRQLYSDSWKVGPYPAAWSTFQSQLTSGINAGKSADSAFMAGVKRWFDDEYAADISAKNAAAQRQFNAGRVSPLSISGVAPSDTRGVFGMSKTSQIDLDLVTKPGQTRLAGYNKAGGFVTVDGRDLPYEDSLGTLFSNILSEQPGQVDQKVTSALKRAYDLSIKEETRSEQLKKFESTQSLWDSPSSSLKRELSESDKFLQYFKGTLLKDKMFVRDDEKKTYVPNLEHQLWKKTLFAQ